MLYGVLSWEEELLGMRREQGKDADTSWDLPWASPGWVDIDDVFKILEVGDAIDHHFLIWQQLDFDRG